MYKPTIGLEIHSEIITKSKLFCGCRNDSDEIEPNVNICPICTGYPGSMPFINKKAIESMIKIGIALNGEVADFTEFDRKHYFYPDIPKGYQISQYKFPIVKKANLLDVDITRIHLEEDTAKNIHDKLYGDTLIDFNRSGVPLMELVTEPVIKSAKQAVDFVKELQLVLKYLQVSKARMEMGEMRVEVNLSISKDVELGQKVEIKNLNSFKAVEGAIKYEIKRQSELLDKGEKILQETRGWNENTSKTISQREKETSDEYRYMAEPDIPKLYLSKCEDLSIEKIKKEIEKLPADYIKSYLEIGLKENQVKIIVDNIEMNFLFSKLLLKVEEEKLKLIANYLTTDILSYVNTEKPIEVILKNINENTLISLSEMITSGDVSSRGAKDLIAILIEKGGDPKEVAKQKGLLQDSNEENLTKIVLEVLKENEKVVQEYKNGKETSLQFLVGQVMKQSKGTANPQKVSKILIKEIS